MHIIVRLVFILFFFSTSLAYAMQSDSLPLGVSTYLAPGSVANYDLPPDSGGRYLCELTTVIPPFNVEVRVNQAGSYQINNIIFRPQTTDSYSLIIEGEFKQNETGHLVVADASYGKGNVVCNMFP